MAFMKKVILPCTFSQSISTHCFICVIQFNWFNLYHSFCFAGGVWRPIESLGEAKARTQTGDSLGCNFNFVYLMPVFQDDSWFVWNHVLRKYCQLRINAVRNILCEFVASTCLLQLICQFCNLSPWRRKVQTSLVSNISVQESRQFSYKVRTFLCISISNSIRVPSKFDLSKIGQLNRQTLMEVYFDVVDVDLVAVESSGILKGKQKLTFNSDILGGIDFTKLSKLTMCSA